MSDNYPPDGDDPTRGHRPYEEQDPTRVERPVPPYEERSERTERREYVEPRHYAGDPAARSIWAPLVTVGLLCTLLGLGLGYLFFHENGLRGGVDETTTTTASTISTTSTTERLTTTTTQATTTTTSRPTTTTTSGTSSTTTIRTTTTAGG